MSGIEEKAALARPMLSWNSAYLAKTKEWNRFQLAKIREPREGQIGYRKTGEGVR